MNELEARRQPPASPTTALGLVVAVYANVIFYSPNGCDGFYRPFPAVVTQLPHWRRQTNGRQPSVNDGHFGISRGLGIVRRLGSDSLRPLPDRPSKRKTLLPDQRGGRRPRCPSATSVQWSQPTTIEAFFRCCACGIKHCCTRRRCRIAAACAGALPRFRRLPPNCLTAINLSTPTLDNSRRCRWTISCWIVRQARRGNGFKSIDRLPGPPLKAFRKAAGFFCNDDVFQRYAKSRISGAGCQNRE